MGLSTINSDLEIVKWQDNFLEEYVTENPWSRYFGTDEGSPIQIVEDLSKGAGAKVWLSFVGKLADGGGVTGDNTLEGNEDLLDTYGDEIEIDQLRKAVATAKMAQKRTTIDMLRAGKVGLKRWFNRNMHLRLIDVACSGNLDGTTAYASCTEAQKDAFLAANSDRVIFGAALSNNAANDHSACLTTLDATNDTFTAANLRFMKRQLKVCDPLITPYDSGEYGDWFVAICGSRAFRDFKASMDTINTSAEVRGKDNPLYRDGDLLYDGVVVREDPDMLVVADVGDGGTVDVSPVLWLGAQALGLAWGQRPTVVTSTRDYGNINGTGIAEIKGMKRLHFNNVMHGMGIHWVAAEPDA